jgi:membrane associated rhomboid family serine protease
LESQKSVQVEHNAADMSRPSAAVFFSIGAAVDFVFGLVKWHSIVAGIVGIICGLPLTGLLYLSFKTRWKGDDDSGR